MTRKDYIAIAAAFRVERPGKVDASLYYQWHKDLLSITDVLQYDNPRFNRERFLRAAGAIER